MMVQHNHNPPSSRRCQLGSHRHRLLPAALAFFASTEQSLSLMFPRQQCISRQHFSIQPHYCHRGRRKSSSELQLQFSSNQDGSYFMNSNSLLQTHLNSYMRSISYPSTTANHDSRHSGVSGRFPTSLSMSKGSESTGGGFGKGSGDKKKKRDNNKNPNNSNPRRKGNKGASKGNTSGKDSTTDRPKGKTKRTRRRNNNKTNTKKQPKNKSKSNNKKGRAKSKASSKYGASILNTEKSSIKTNDENNSLKGFKSENPRPIAPIRQPEGQMSGDDGSADEESDGAGDVDIQKRVVQLEMLVSNQMTEIQKLRREIEDLTRATGVFSNVIDVLREAGLKIDEEEEVVAIEDDDENEGEGKGSVSSESLLQQQTTFQDDMEIFGMAPKSTTDAADAAGASILSAILAGKHRMLVDVRDAELTRDPKLFVEFIELAILPVAAGLEGMDGDEYVRNRVKIVFPTVKELMTYRRSMALAAPDVVSLSTLGFDPVDERDNLIVVVAPSPDDIAGVMAMDKLLARTDPNYVEPDKRITQPFVVLNHHMVPVEMAGFGKFTSVYHLRLLSVQYMTGDATPEYVAKGKSVAPKSKDGVGDNIEGKKSGSDKQNSTSTGALTKEGKAGASDRSDEEDAALEAAMTHAHEIGVHQGVTRAMVIRAYPKPWNVFVDTSPDTDADFEVAATFDYEPTPEDVNYAIVECLEGSEREDEIVAQQMQAALDAGQLNRVSDMLGISPSDIIVSDDSGMKAASSEEANNGDDTSDDDDSPYDGNDWDDLYYDDWFSEDSV